MENKTIIPQLGLPETTTDAEITERIGEFRTAKEENEGLRKRKDKLILANITSLVERAIGEKCITVDKKDEFISLGKEIGVEELTSVLSAMSPQVKLSAALGQHRTVRADILVTYKKLSEVLGDKLLEMRE